MEDAIWDMPSFPDEVAYLFDFVSEYDDDCSLAAQVAFLPPDARTPMTLVVEISRVDDYPDPDHPRQACPEGSADRSPRLMIVAAPPARTQVQTCVRTWTWWEDWRACAGPADCLRYEGLRGYRPAYRW